MYYLIVYDADISRVNKINKFLKRYLNWIQNSVFEGELNDADYLAVKKQLNTIINKDTVKHTLTTDDGSVDSGLIAEGESKTVKAPTNAGLYSFKCTPHPWMRGVMIVE